MSFAGAVLQRLAVLFVLGALFAAAGSLSGCAPAGCSDSAGTPNTTGPTGLSGQGRAGDEENTSFNGMDPNENYNVYWDYSPTTDANGNTISGVPIAQGQPNPSSGMRWYVPATAPPGPHTVTIIDSSGNTVAKGPFEVLASQSGTTSGGSTAGGSTGGVSAGGGTGTGGTTGTTGGSQMTLTLDGRTTYYDGSDGVLSPLVLLPQGATRVTFHARGSVITDSSGTLFSPDGLNAQGQPGYNFTGTRFSGTYNGVPLGATTGVDPAVFGVFFSSSVTGTAPDSANYRTDSGVTPDPRTAASYSPRLNQPFYIGDGYTGNAPYTPPNQVVPPSGIQQTFNVPAGAKYLMVGFGADNRLSDNAGSLVVQVSVR